MSSDRKTVDEQRTVTLKVPFQPGTELEIVREQHGTGFYMIYMRIPKAQAEQPVDLRGTVKAYRQPLRPVAEEDWDALK